MVKISLIVTDGVDDHGASRILVDNSTLSKIIANVNKNLILVMRQGLK